METQSEVSQVTVGGSGQHIPKVNNQPPADHQEPSSLDAARSPYMSFDLPNGYLDYDNMNGDKPMLHKNVELQEITGREEDMLMSRDGDANKKMNNLMTACVRQIGPYTEKPKIAQIVKKLLSIDRFFLIYKIREISLGNEYRFSSPCPNCGDDKLRFTDLSEVNFPSIPDTYTRVFECVLPRTQKKVKWKLQDGEMEDKAQKSMKATNSNVLSSIILQRLVDFDGRPATIQDVQGLPSFDRNFLRQQFAKNEGEIDDKIDVACPNCGHEFVVETNIGDKEFFFPTV